MRCVEIFMQKDKLQLQHFFFVARTEWGLILENMHAALSTMYFQSQDRFGRNDFTLYWHVSVGQVMPIGWGAELERCG